MPFLKHRYVFAGIATLVALSIGGACAKSGGDASTCKIPDRAQVRIPGGTFLMGSQQYEEEGPVRRVTIAPFWIDRFDVTNAQFAHFVATTGYVTDAERKPNPKDYPEVAADKLSSGGAVFKSPADGA